MNLDAISDFDHTILDLDMLVRSFTNSPIRSIDLYIGYKLGPIFFWQVQINLFLFAENNVVVNFFQWNYSTRSPFLEILCRPFCSKNGGKLEVLEGFKGSCESLCHKIEL